MIQVVAMLEFIPTQSFRSLPQTRSGGFRHFSEPVLQKVDIYMIMMLMTLPAAA